MEHNPGSFLDMPIKVKISGDGAPFSHSRSFVLLSFSFPSLKEALSESGMYMTVYTMYL